MFKCNGYRIGSTIMDPRDVRTEAINKPNGRGFTQRNGRSIGELIKELRDESSMLLRQEVALAKTEISEKAMKAGRNGAYLAVGALIAYAGLIFVLLAANRLVWMGLTAGGVPGEHAAWLAPLIVGLVVAGVGCFAAMKAIHTFRQADEFIPHKTVDSLQENTRWARQKVA